MAVFEPYCLPTSVGSLPHTDPKAACLLILKYLPQIPAWPQLPKRGFRENMLAQFLSDFPAIEFEGGKIKINTASLDLNGYLEKINRGDVEEFSISREDALGLYAFLESELGSPILLKGQITGPVSCGLGIIDEASRPIIYNDVVIEAMSKHLKFKAMWQEKKLLSRWGKTMLWIDEPYLALLGSSLISLPQDRMRRLLNEVLSGIRGIKGVHCCGNTDWSFILSLPIDVVNFDAYDFGEKFSLYPEEVRGFLDRGGLIAWGIVPSDEAALSQETVPQLKDRLEEAMVPFTRRGIRFKKILAQALLTPTCGLGNISPDGAERALELLSGLSQKIRSRYGGV